MSQVKQNWFLGKSFIRMKSLYKELVAVTNRKDVDGIIMQLYEIVESCHATLLEWSADDETYSRFIQGALAELASTDWSAIFIEIIDIVYQDLSYLQGSDKIKLLVELLHKCFSCAEVILTVSCL